MKNLGILLIIAGVLCFAIGFSPILGFLNRIDDPNPSPAAIADSVSSTVQMLATAGFILVALGFLAFNRGVKKDLRKAKTAVKRSFRRRLVVPLMMLAGFTATLFGIYWYITSWHPDKAWAAGIIEESMEIRKLLDEYREDNGEFPKSLDEITAEYTQPTEFLSRKAQPPGVGQWYYERMGTDDYQLYVTAYSWVSYFDAVVFRKSGSFTERWFRELDPARIIKLGNWRYIRGFSRYDGS